MAVLSAQVRPIAIGAVALVGLTSAATAQQPTPARSSDTDQPAQMTYAPPVHVAPVRSKRSKVTMPTRASREQPTNAVAQGAQAAAIPADEAIGSGVRRVASTQFVDEPLKITGSDETSLPAVRISQTPASPSTRPRVTDPSPAPPMQLESVLPGDELVGDSQPSSNDEAPLPEKNQLRSNEPIARPISTPKRLMRSYQEESNTEDTEDELKAPKKSSKSCDEFRNELLGKRIVDISLDVSPPPNVKQAATPGVFREWRDIGGNLLASGTLVDIRRGYIIIDSNGSLLKISAARLGESDISAIAEVWQVPVECIVTTGVFPGRCWEPQTVTWYASNLCHKPLYFEHVQLERYGHSAGPYMGPLCSTAHFFGSVITFPYHTAIHPPNECVYPLGYYRPGNCAPWLVEPFPISLKGAIRQAAVVTGGFFVF
ncbi:MAG: hypothetical protein ABL888_08075 [Pirellulaceae bacterium]